MRVLFILLLFLSIQNIGNTQENKDAPILVRGLKDFRITKSDSLFIKTLESDIKTLNSVKINTIPSILNDCDISMYTKLEIVKLLFNKSEKIDTALFKIIGESLFFTAFHEKNYNAISRYPVLDQIYRRSNAVDFCKHVIDMNLLNKCGIYSENCSYPRDEVENFTQSEAFLSLFAEMYKGEGIEKIDSIKNTTSNNCIFYNLSRIKHHILKN